jgi:transposase-like protein
MDFSGKQFPRSVILMAVRWYLAYSLSSRNMEEMFAEFGVIFDHSIVQRWVVEYGEQLKHMVNKYSRKNFKRSWRLDETYIKVKGNWCYLYRIVDKDGDSIAFHLSKTRDHQAALKCIRSAIKVAGFVPNKINSDGSTANELAVEILNRELILKWHAKHSNFCGPMKPTISYTKVKYCNNILEQDHRRIKRIVDHMMGFKSFEAATSTIAGIEAIAMIRKQQTVFSDNGRILSIADQIELMVA